MLKIRRKKLPVLFGDFLGEIGWKDCSMRSLDLFILCERWNCSFPPGGGGEGGVGVSVWKPWRGS